MLKLKLWGMLWHIAVVSPYSCAVAVIAKPSKSALLHVSIHDMHPCHGL